jgi:hypothetical protein
VGDLQVGDAFPKNWEELAAYTGPTGHKDRESEWNKRGEETQDDSDE